MAWVASLLVLAMGHLPCPPRARACVIDPGDPTLDGIPADGDTDVPTNVVPIFFFLPWFESTTDGVPGTFVIETLNGVPVESTVRLAGRQWFEIVPAKSLEPNTGYRIRGSWNQRGGAPFETQLEFTTGAGPRTGTVAAPVAKLQHLDWQTNVITSCDGEMQRTCVALEGDGMVAYEFIDEFGQIADGFEGFARASFFTTVLTTKLPQATNFRCIRLRTRAVDGTYSETTKLCGEDAPVFHVAFERDAFECTNEGLVVPKGARTTKDGKGVSLPMRGDAGAAPAAGQSAAAGRGGSVDPGEGGAPAVDPGSDAKHVEACSVRPGWGQSATGPTAAFATWLVAWMLRRRRANRQK